VCPARRKPRPVHSSVLPAHRGKFILPDKTSIEHVSEFIVNVNYFRGLHARKHTSRAAAFFEKIVGELTDAGAEGVPTFHFDFHGDIAGLDAKKVQNMPHNYHGQTLPRL